ncbi:MAG: hypothetical protein HY473_02145 [Candidatus Sungbacteria bacterium]|uniref:Type 4 fimbrial biogenesis protein PilX N-terminal domain-containing protein n=1 Tax=Candidatus Sungiibacteriota bacterium TaxID=2750080 RepID=A0A932YYZ0_9BACT|nr:hypothetical protein [Candidatus Sungbacteria bacterium]
MRFRDSRPGITFLLVILILSALLAISINISNIVVGQIRLSGEIGDSLVALYAADQGIEYLLYCDRVAGANCDSADPPCLGGTGDCTYGPQSPGARWSPAAADSCTIVTLTRQGDNVTLTSSGEFRCGNPQVSVKRALRAFYENE